LYEQLSREALAASDTTTSQETAKTSPVAMKTDLLQVTRSSKKTSSELLALPKKKIEFINGLV